MKHTPSTLLALLLKNREPKSGERVRLTTKQYNWLESTCFRYGDTLGELIIWHPCAGACRAGYAGKATTLEIKLNGDEYYCRREFNGSGHVERKEGIRA